MKKIWFQRITLAEGWDGMKRTLEVKGWWSKKTGTLHIIFRLFDHVYDWGYTVEEGEVFGTQTTRENAILEVLQRIEEKKGELTPEAERVCAISIERKRWSSNPELEESDHEDLLEFF